MRTLLPLVAALALCACEGRTGEAMPDFGAAQLAYAGVAAERACAAAGFEDLPSCTGSTVQDARRGAKAVIDMEATYLKACSADLGRDKCDEMLTSAYLVAKK